MGYKKGGRILYEQNSLNAEFYRKFLGEECNIWRYEWEACGYAQNFPGTLNEKQSQPRPMISTWSQVEQVLTGVVESCLGGADVKETLESAKEEIEAIGK